MSRRERDSEQYAIDVISKAEEIFQGSGTKHRFVGGAVANPISLETVVVINAALREALLHSHKPLSLIRPDGTVRDLDAIGFSRFPDSYQQARRLLQEETVKARKHGLP